MLESHKELNLEILSMLIECKEPLTAEDIAGKTGKSSRTIRTYLKEIAEILQEDGIALVRKPNVGIYLLAEENERKCLKDKYIRRVNKCEVYDSKYRKDYILEILLVNKFKYTMQMFADDLYCCKSTIANDFEAVDEWLTKHKLKLVRKKNRGFWIEGTEIEFRSAIMAYLTETDKTDIPESDLNLEDVDFRLSITNFNKLREFFPDIDLMAVQNLILKAEENLGSSFADQAFINLITHIAITIKRVKEKQEIIMPQEFNEKFKNTDIYPVAEILVEGIEKAFKVEMPEDEVCYICLHLLGSKIHENITDDNCQDILDIQDEFNIKIAKEIIDITGEVLNIDLGHDEILLASLVLHIRPVIVRLENGLKLNNPMLQTIKNEYGNIFCASWVAGTIFENECGLMINEDEVAYIAMHIAAAIERLDKRVKTIVVCSSGIGTAQWIKSKLTRKFSNLEIIRVLSVDKLTPNMMESCDLIISTVPYKINSKKAVYISALLNNEDIDRIKETIGELDIRTIDYLTEITSTIDLELISEDYCFIENDIKDYHEIIKKYGEFLIQDNYAKQGYIESVLEREVVSSTYLGKGISIPHSSIEYVNKSKIAVIKLGNPIMDKRDPIEIIFMLCLKIDGYGIATNIFTEFYGMIDNDEYMKQLKFTNDPKEMNKMLRRFNYGKTGQRELDK
ncbi:MAG: PRD domain-containing protein [Eubacteriaceae bacterium]|nr:PRD domain-containing protein [Eubacteriaceae bacterium]